MGRLFGRVPCRREPLRSVKDEQGLAEKQRAAARVECSLSDFILPIHVLGSP